MLFIKYFTQNTSGLKRSVTHSVTTICHQISTCLTTKHSGSDCSTMSFSSLAVAGVTSLYRGGVYDLRAYLRSLEFLLSSKISSNSSFFFNMDSPCCVGENIVLR